jgi:hypothetical protein
MTRDGVDKTMDALWIPVKISQRRYLRTYRPARDEIPISRTTYVRLLNCVIFCPASWLNCDSSVRMVTRLRAGLLGFDSGKGQIFSPRHFIQTNSGAQPAFYTFGYRGILPLEKSGRSMKLANHLVPTLRMKWRFTSTPHTFSQLGS